MPRNSRRFGNNGFPRWRSIHWFPTVGASPIMRDSPISPLLALMNAKQPDVQKKLRIGIIVVLAAVYLLQIVCTPLRLSIDTVVLLSAAESAARGEGLLYHGHLTQYPPGYPILIAVLMRLGIAHVWLIVGISVGSLLLGLAAAHFFLLREFFSDETSLLIVWIVSLLSFVTIKYTVIPLTDPLFFGVAMCSLVMMSSAASQFTWRKLALGVVLVLVSISIRKVGVTLIPALMWPVVTRSRSSTHYQPPFCPNEGCDWSRSGFRRDGRHFMAFFHCPNGAQVCDD